MEINQYDITISTHYDITMGNDVARNVHCEITMVNDVPMDVHCDIIMSNDVAVCTYHGITMHNDVAMDIYFLLCIIYSMSHCVILLWVLWNKNKNKFMFDQSGL